MNRDGAFGAAGLVLAAAYYLIAADVPESQLSDAVGPQGLPKIYATVLAGLSLILIVQSGRREAVEDRRAMPMSRPAGLLALGAIYLLVVPWLGYIASVAALIAATTWYQGQLINRQIVLVAVGGAIVFWLLFVVLLRVPHPPGLWPSLL